MKDKFLIEVQVYDGKKVIDSFTSVIILSISRIKQYLDKGRKTNFDMVVVDECDIIGTNQRNIGFDKFSPIK